MRITLPRRDLLVRVFPSVVLIVKAGRGLPLRAAIGFRRAWLRSVAETSTAGAVTERREAERMADVNMVL
jgi:hypothetical protein